MLSKFIEETENEFEEKFAGSFGYCNPRYSRLIKEFYFSKLKQSYILGLQRAKELLPEPKKPDYSWDLIENPQEAQQALVDAGANICWHNMQNKIDEEKKKI